MDSIIKKDQKIRDFVKLIEQIKPRDAFFEGEKKALLDILKQIRIKN